jgi:hypothetical protein
MEKQRGMEFGFRKTATAVKNTGQTDYFILSIVTEALIYTNACVLFNKILLCVF